MKLSKITQTLFTLTALVTLGGNSPSRALPNSTFELAQTFKPPGRGAPPRTADAGTRGCSVSQTNGKPLTPLIPAKDLALTTNEYPTLFWYVPQSPGKTLQFTLLDQNDETIIYQTEMAAPSQSGIVAINLSEIQQKSDKMAGLEADRLYHWYMVMVCDPEDRTGDLIVDGWIGRINASDDLQERLANVPPENHAKIYAEEGIWHDALAAIAQEQNTTEWETLLNSVELGAFTQAPIISPSPL